jgi:hypothetical protein
MRDGEPHEPRTRTCLRELNARWHSQLARRCSPQKLRTARFLANVLAQREAYRGLTTRGFNTTPPPRILTTRGQLLSQKLVMTDQPTISMSSHSDLVNSRRLKLPTPRMGTSSPKMAATAGFIGHSRQLFVQRIVQAPLLPSRSPAMNYN